MCEKRLRKEIETAIADGFTTFISGFAEGVDLIFAELVIEQKEKQPHLFKMDAAAAEYISVVILSKKAYKYYRTLHKLV